MTINSDIPVFFDEFFAQDIAAITDKGGAKTIRAIFDNEAEIIRDGVISVKPRIIVKTEDVTFMNKNWYFRINGTEYDILEAFPNNHGVREIFLREYEA